MNYWERWRPADIARDAPIMWRTMADLHFSTTYLWELFYPSGWADFEWVWAYGHLCQGCGYPRYEGLHGMSEYGGCV